MQNTPFLQTGLMLSGKTTATDNPTPLLITLHIPQSHPFSPTSCPSLALFHQFLPRIRNDNSRNSSSSNVLRISHCSMYFRYINSLNPHNNPLR